VVEKAGRVVDEFGSLTSDGEVGVSLVDPRGVGVNGTLPVFVTVVEIVESVQLVVHYPH
jgi:hypothetical protein